jgi:hypothetical protein
MASTAERDQQGSVHRAGKWSSLRPGVAVIGCRQ